MTCRGAVEWSIWKFDTKNVTVHDIAGSRDVQKKGKMRSESEDESEGRGGDGGGVLKFYQNLSLKSGIQEKWNEMINMRT